ncbi:MULTISPECIES: hypothetical protein [Sphingomonas]|jgi:hypothetical protein|uniref:hypothetical protein n=1 Tax=Sphingomonas TaxID=13687 RepID=UPI000B1FBD3C|nr:MULTISPECIES: hypothetical protein [Sphingomonas]
MDNPAISRLEAAIDRIERVVDERRTAAAVMERRHALLRQRMGEAVAALDEIIAGEGND